MAANSILKLKVESEEYDAKLKKAAEGIRHLADVAHRSGGELTGLEKSELDYIRALGDMETKSKTAAGATRELENAFKELTVIYNNLNDVEKADEGGKALAASLETLKQRAIDAKAGLNEATQALQGNEQSAGADKTGIEGLTSALGINVKSLAGWGTALAAGKVALDVAKDAFMANESSVDEWGRTVESAKGIYEGFLQALNTGDFSGFLDNISQITAAAREAYNALDELGTRQTILNPERAKLQARSTELKATIRREGADSSAGKAAAKELKALEKPLTDAWRTESKLNRNAFEALVKERLKEGGINLNQKSFSQFMKTFSDDKAFQQLRRGASGSVTTGTYGNAGITATKTIDTRNTNQKLLDLFTDEWRKKNSGYLAAAYNAEGSAASTMLSDARYLKGGKGGGAGGGKSGMQDIQFSDDSIMAQEKLVQELTQKWKTASGELRDGYLKDLEEAQQKLAELTGKAKGPDLDAMFPDMSKENYNTGYAGSAQAKYDSARVDLALGPMNLDAVNTYIGSVKGMLKDADLGSELYNNMTEKLKDATTVSTLLQEMMERGLAGADLETAAQSLKEKLLSPEGIDQTAIQSFLDELNKQIEEAGGVGLKLNADTGEVTDDKRNGKEEGDGFMKFHEDVGKLTGGLSSVSSGLRALGIDIPKEVDQMIGVINGVSQVISGIGTIISLVGTGAMTANTTAVSLNTAAIGGLIAALEFNTATNFIPVFAGGGVIPHAATGYYVPGNNYSGDTTPILANAGELVLNKAQQGNLASQLEGGGIAQGTPEARISGEDIWITLNNYTQRSGYGEIVTSK
jgi:cell division FtsZ-interacting protein ZapD